MAERIGFDSPGHEAAYDWITRTAGFLAAVHYQLWRSFVMRGMPAREIATQLRVRPRKVWRWLADGADIDLMHLSYMCSAMELRIKFKMDPIP